MKKTYNRNRAKQLVPLLAAITREIDERLHEMEVLEHRIALIDAQPVRDGDKERLHLNSELATHRREVRLARKELERLGCVVDESRPGHVYIPGLDGDPQRGFRWSSGDGTFRRVTNTSVG